jgi:DHA1 family tetracycline resistance protein-like MFS transporter
MSKRSPLAIAFFTIFLDLVGFGIVIPIAPFYAEQFGATATTITLLGSSYSLMQFIFAPIWGRLSDKIGRRPIVLMSISFGVVGHFLFGIADSITFLFVSRMIAGFGNANIGAVQAIISDVTTPENRAKGMGLIGAAFGLGFILGPALGGFFGQHSASTPAFVAAGLGLINLVIAFMMLPETLSSKTATRSRFDVAALKKAADRPNVLPVLAVTAIYVTAFAMMEQVISLYLEHSHLGESSLTGHDKIKEAAELSAYFFVAVGITATVVQGGLIGRLTKKFGEVKLARLGAVVLALSMLSVPYFVGQLPGMWMLVSAVVMALGSGMLNPSITSLLSRSAGKDEQGGILGWNQSIGSLGRVIGPAFAGVFYEMNMDYPFIISGVMIGFAGIVAWWKFVAPPAGSVGGHH